MKICDFCKMKDPIGQTIQAYVPATNEITIFVETIQKQTVTKKVFDLCLQHTEQALDFFKR